MLETKKYQSVKNIFEQNTQKETKHINHKNVVAYIHTLMKELNTTAYYAHMKDNGKKSFLYVLKDFSNDPIVLKEIQKNKKSKKAYNQLLALTETIKLINKVNRWKKNLMKKENNILNKNITILEQKFDGGSINKEQIFNAKKILQTIYENKIKDLKTISTTIISFAFYGESAVNKSELGNYKNLISEFYSNDEYTIIAECTDIINMTSELLELKNDLVVKYYLQALDKAVKAKEKKYDQPLAKLNVAVISFLEKVDLINSTIYLVSNIQQLISLATPFLNVALPYLSGIFTFLPIFFTTPRIIINIGKSLYYHHQNKNWDYFNSVKFEILEDLVLVAASLAFTLLASSTLGTSMLIHPVMIRWIVQNTIFAAIYIISIVIQLYKKHEYNKKINEKISAIDFRIDELIKKNTQSSLSYLKDKKYNELLFLKKNLTEQKNKKNKISNTNIFLLVALGILSPVLLLSVANPSSYNQTLNKLILFSSLIVPVRFVRFIQSINSSAIIDKLDSMVSFFKNRKKTLNENNDIENNDILLQPL